jgi:hypothetical protein
MLGPALKGLEDRRHGRLKDRELRSLEDRYA